jgi:hypothetical protein
MAEEIKMKTLRWGVALLCAVIVFPISYIIFNIGFMLWAEKVYPHRNSMAGVVAFIYGFPVGLAVSLVIFAMVLVTTRRKMPKSAQK